MRELLIFCDMILDVAQKGGKERSCLRQSMAMENNGRGIFPREQSQDLIKDFTYPSGESG